MVNSFLKSVQMIQIFYTLNEATIGVIINVCIKIKTDHFSFFLKKTTSCVAFVSFRSNLLFRSILMGAELYAELRFFVVQSILTDRYIHRREMRAESLEIEIPFLCSKFNVLLKNMFLPIVLLVLPLKTKQLL